MSNAINRRLAVLETYYAEIDAAIAVAARVIDTYSGMLSLCNDGEGSDAAIVGLSKWESEIAQLKADRAEIDHMWNEVVE